MARILVIEDNQISMKLTTLLLQNVGHTVLGANDAETGLIQARQYHPDLILMDFQLPGMDGAAATAQLKRNPETRDIPIIALTAMENKPGKENNPLSDHDAFLSKPLRYQDLYAAISSLISRSSETASMNNIIATQTEGDNSFEIKFPNIASDPYEDGEKKDCDRSSLPVDISVLEALIGENPEVVQDFLSIFRITSKKIAQDLRSACMNQQALLASREAHKLKSSSYAMGAVKLASICVEIEKFGSAGQIEQLASLAGLFDIEFSAVINFIDAAISQHSAAGMAQDNKCHANGR